MLEARALLSATNEGLLPASAVDAVATQSASGDASYPGGVTVTATQILTETEIIPRFAAQPTITATRSGSWSDPSLWSAGHIPSANDRVLIPAAVTIVYATQSDASIDAIEVGGRLLFSTNVSTRLVVGTMTVMPTGELQIGTASRPIAPQVTAELVIADRPLDLADDPRQYGTGLIGLGTVSIFGSVVNQTWTRLESEPRFGQRYLTVANVDPAWQPGDTLVLPDTRQVAWGQESLFKNGILPPHWEEVTIKAVVGNRVILDQSLQFDHLGARDADGVVTLLPHVALLDRNVIIRSQNPQGTRGHTFFTARANVDIEYAKFQDLGRTDAFRDLDNSTFDSAGNVTHVGTNQVGRYAVHFHHLMGPENPTNQGYQFQFIGNTVEGSRKWAVAVHDSSYGRLADNVVYDAQGAGFVTEDGSEINNLFLDNIVIRIVGTQVDGKDGTEEDDYGRGGSGFWFRRGGNYVAGNVAADTSFAGFVIDGYFTDSVTLPSFRGADKHEPGQGYTTQLNPGGLFINNEAYGLTTYGLWAAYISGNNLIAGQPTTTLRDLRLWNVFIAGVYMYHTTNITFYELTIYGDWSAQVRNDTGAVGMKLQIYENIGLRILSSRIEGMYIGIEAPLNSGGKPGFVQSTLIQLTSLKNYINIAVSPASDFGNGNSLTVRDVTFDLLTALPTGPANPAKIRQPANIEMYWTTVKANLTAPSIVTVYNYNQVPGDDFQVYYREQLATYVLPTTPMSLLSGRDYGTVGSPTAGLNNLQTWLRYGIAAAGSYLTLSQATTRAAIRGYVRPIADASAITPRVVLVTPWDGATLNGAQPVRIRYNVDGQLPIGASVWFALDDQKPFNIYFDGGPFGVAPGTHTLRVWIGDAQGIELPNTVGTSATFVVSGTSPAVASAAIMSAADETTLANATYGAIAPAVTLAANAQAEPAGIDATGAAASQIDTLSAAPVVASTAAALQHQAWASAECRAPDTLAAEGLFSEELLTVLAADVVSAELRATALGASTS